MEYFRAMKYLYFASAEQNPAVQREGFSKSSEVLRYPASSAGHQILPLAFLESFENRGCDQKQFMKVFSFSGSGICVQLEKKSLRFFLCKVNNLYIFEVP